MRNKSWIESTCGLAVVLSGILLLATTGCHLRPNLGSPGTIGMQRDRAVLHDPYPRNDLGPAIVSGRPLGFDVPRAETVDYQDNPFSHISLRNPNLFRRAPGSPPRAQQNFFGGQQQFGQPAITPQPGFAPQTVPQGFPQSGFGQPGFPQQPAPQAPYPLQGSGFRN